MTATNRRRGPRDPSLLVAVAVAGALGLFTAVNRFGAVVLPVVPACGLLFWGAGELLRGRRGVHARFDRVARHLAHPRQLRHVTSQGVAEAAARLGARTRGVPGVYVGRGVRGGQDLWGSWEDMHLDIWGPRTGKTTSRAIPSVVAAPGCVVVASNKRDIVDATRGVRERHGRVWVFDPQNQAGERPSWWWNPLSFIEGSVRSALLLAGLMAGVNRPSHARSDGFFEPAGENLFGYLLLAAQLDDRPITDVYVWLTNPSDDTPARILRRAGERRAAATVHMVISSPAKQRAGVYGTALQMASFLIAPGIAEWITPSSDGSRLEFRHADFAGSDCETLYLLSEETNKMAAPIVLSLTTAVAYSAEGRSADCPGGRLPVPALFVLDEAANICPLEELTFFYTHYGSRGIVMMTFLQSWAQGVAVWGETGMAQLWGSANVRVYGGGVSDMRFLRDLSQSTGRFEPSVWSLSRHPWWTANPAVGLSSRSEFVLDEADLAALPRGRAFVQFSGAPPTLVKPVPWWRGPYAAEIRASLERYAPKTAAPDRGP